MDEGEDQRPDIVRAGVTRALGARLMPRVRAMFGAIESDAGENQGVTGFEVELALRF